MRYLIAAALVFAVPAASAQAGCITGAVGGGIAGHMAGHGKLGAAAGCAVGHHNAKKERTAAEPAAAIGDLTDVLMSMPGLVPGICVRRPLQGPAHERDRSVTSVQGSFWIDNLIPDGAKRRSGTGELQGGVRFELAASAARQEVQGYGNVLARVRSR